ncbi:MAG TPA: M20/M25/M40 family metallo-hydrolase, partial [Spirochaetes bacterium]|nr:M20/M25/M40 family metallo-hydrolase [Spirochaetota bacterium]
ALEVTEKMSMKLRLTTHGRSGHGNQPPPETALTSLAEWITRIHGLKYPMDIHPAVREAFRRLAGRKKFPESLLLRFPDLFPFRALVGREMGSDPTMNALTRTTIAVTVLRSGEAYNVVPGRAEAVLDVRMIPGTDPEKVIADIRSLTPGADADIEILSPPEAGEATPFGTPAFQIIEEALLAAVPGALVVPFMDIGGSDSKHLRAKGVPCYGIIPAVITEEELGTIHGINERLSVENLCRGTEIMYSALLRLCNEGL